MLSNDDLKTFFYQLKYNDSLFIKAFTALKNYKGQLNFDNFMLFYCRTYIFQDLDLNESPTFIFNLEFPFSDYVPSLYYANPDFYTQSFYSQVYRKNIMLQFLKSYEVIQFLQNLDIDYNFICSHLLNTNSLPQEIFSFGFISLDYILQKFKGNELSNFKQNIGLNIIYIFINQICEIFSDFIQNGSTKSKSLLDKSNEFGKFLLEKIFEGTVYFLNPKIRIGRTLKCLILSYPLLRFRFFEENKQRILTLLSSYAFSISKHENIFDKFDSDAEIFNLIDQNIISIVDDKTKWKKNNSDKNLVIINKLLDLYKLKYENIDELYSYDFYPLLQNIIEKDYPLKLMNKVLEIVENSPNKNNTLSVYLNYILKITLLFCTTTVGGLYLFNSNFIPKMVKLIQKLTFNDYPNFILEILIILQISFNRKIIDISFLRLKNVESNMSLKEFMINILFRNEPVLSNNSFYYFDHFDKLFNRVNKTYSFLFEKNNIDLFCDSFININFEDSYLNIIKSIGLNMSEEFDIIEWKNEINKNPIDNTYDDDILEENEKNFDKKINEEIHTVKTKIPGFILLDFLRCLENLNQTNFNIQYQENSFFTDNKYDLVSIIINDKVPFAIKSVLLNFLLKFVLCEKADSNNNKIYGPLLFTSLFEKFPFETQIKGKNLITVESKESEKHLNETVKLMNIFIICIELLKAKEKSLNFEKAFIEKNGLYDFCVSIILSISYFSNLIVNTNKIHELYLIGFSKLAYKFFEKETEKIFMTVLNKKIEHKEIDFKVNNKFAYQEQISIIVDVNLIIQQYIDKINLDSYKFFDRKIFNIYQSFINYHKGELSSDSSNHYSFILEFKQNKENEDKTLEELNEFNGLGSKINSTILNNYKEWNKYIDEECKKIKKLLDTILNSKIQAMSRREMFFSFVLFHIAYSKSEGEYMLNDNLFLKCLIRMIRSDDKFVTVCDDEKMEIMKDNSFKDKKEINIQDFKARTIGGIIKKIYFLTNYELLISSCFSNTEQENKLSELLNSLILFLEVLAEHFNTFFHDSMFKYKFDLSKDKDNIPVAKYDEESKTFIKLKEDVDEKNIYSPYEVLLNLHQKIFESLYINNDEYYRETQQNNLLIIFHSLTYCIIEYTNFDNPEYRSIMQNLYKDYFFWQKEDKSVNPVFHSINFEIDHNTLDKVKYIFVKNNLLSLFIFYIRYGPKEINKNYFY